MWGYEYNKFKKMKEGPEKLSYAIKMLVRIRLETKLEYITNK